MTTTLIRFNSSLDGSGPIPGRKPVEMRLSFFAEPRIRKRWGLIFLGIPKPEVMEFKRAQFACTEIGLLIVGESSAQRSTRGSYSIVHASGKIEQIIKFLEKAVTWI
jgi:hypothetical protein